MSNFWLNDEPTFIIKNVSNIPDNKIEINIDHEDGGERFYVCALGYNTILESWNAMVKNPTSVFYVEAFINFASYRLSIQDYPKNKSLPRRGVYRFQNGRIEVPGE